MRMPDYTDSNFKKNYHAYLDRPLSFWASYSHYIGYMFSAFGLFGGLAFLFLPDSLKLQRIEGVPVVYIVICVAIGLCGCFVTYFFAKRIKSTEHSRCDSKSYENLQGIFALRRDVKDWEERLSFNDIERASYHRRTIRSKFKYRFTGLELSKFFVLIAYGVTALVIGSQGASRSHSGLEVLTMLFFFFISAVGWLAFSNFILGPIFRLLNSIFESVSSFSNAREAHLQEIEKYKRYNDEMIGWVKVIEKNSDRSMTIQEYNKRRLDLTL